MDKTLTEEEVRYFDYERAGRYCSTSRWSIFRASKVGHLNRYGSDAAPRFRKDELDAWMSSGAPTA